MKRATCAAGASLTVLSAFLLLSAAPLSAQGGGQDSQPGRGAITVRGHWIVDVHEADGTLAKRHEFDNHLTNPLALARLFSRQQSMGTWHVALSDTLANNAPCETNGNRSCHLLEAGDPNRYSGTNFLALTVGLEGTPSPDKLVLQGTFTAQRAGQISYVSAELGLCANNIAPATPCSAGSQQLTQRLLQGADTVPVSAGQVVQLRVEISFTAAP
jgi:hypothetical protein